LVVLPLLALSAPPAWQSSISNNQTGNPIPREFQTLTNIPGTPLNILFSGVTYNGTTFDLTDTWILDTSLPAWKFANPDPYPPPRGYAVSAATPTEVFLFGGRNEAVPMAFFEDVWRYNIVANKWTQDVFNSPSAYLRRSYSAGVLVVDTLYVFGGYVPAMAATSNDLWSYNTTSKVWLQLSGIGRAGSPPPRQGHSAVFYNDTTSGPSIIFFGGYNGTGGSSDTWQYILRTNAFKQLTQNNDTKGPAPRWGQSAVLGNSPTPTVIIFGGSFVGGLINPYFNDVWELALSPAGTWNWTMLMPNDDVTGPWKRAGHSTVVSRGGVYTFGGYGMYIGLYNDLWELTNV